MSTFVGNTHTHKKKKKKKKKPREMPSKDPLRFISLALIYSTKVTPVLHL